MKIQPRPTTITQPRWKRLKKALKIIGILVTVLTIWILIDLKSTSPIDIRQFDPNEVARLETVMWRSYYAKERLKLFFELGELLRRQYHFHFFKSHVVAYSAAKAAFVFKDGHSRVDYEKALPDLQNFYREIRQVSNVPFDPDRAAKLELEWWIVHRERANHAPGDLEHALADLGAELYRIPAERLDEHARLRAEAMIIRDTKAKAGGVTEQDWTRIDQLLHQSWQSLWKAVNTS